MYIGLPEQLLKFFKKARAYIDPIRSSYPDYAFYALGDFNIYMLEMSESVAARNFTNLMFCSNLWPVIRRPTRVSFTSHTLIDHVWTNDTNFNHSGIIPNFLTDNFSIFETCKPTARLNSDTQENIT